MSRMMGFTGLVVANLESNRLPAHYKPHFVDEPHHTMSRVVGFIHCGDQRGHHQNL